MRTYLLLGSTALLAACGGGGGDSGTIASTPNPIVSASTHSFAAPTDAKTYVGVGGSQVYEYITDDRVNGGRQQAPVYSSNATTPRNSSISIAYDPRDAIFTLSVTDPRSGATTATRFQDPASRTDFGGGQEPQFGTPRLTNPNIQYLQAGDGDPRSPYRISGSGLVIPGTNVLPATGESGSSYNATSLFFLKPGTETRYVTYAGYARNSFSFVQVAIGGGNQNTINSHLERGAFAYGEMTDNNAVPKSGSGSYSGSMIGSMVYNPTLDEPRANLLPSYFQWMQGTAKLDVDFAKQSFAMSLTGSVMAPQLDYYTSPQNSILAAGATFAAAGKGTINMVNFGGFKGAFDSASFTNPGGPRSDVTIAGSSIDGTFYGPNGEEVGGGFRIVGGNPDERIDILGAFVGKK